MPFEMGSFSLGFVAGGLVIQLGNHLLAKSRDKESRDVKDFNAAADILAEFLIKERCGPMPATNFDFSAFRRVLKGKELREFDEAVAEYHGTRRNAEIIFPNDPGPLVRIGGTGFYRDVNPIVATIDKLLLFTTRR